MDGTGGRKMAKRLKVGWLEGGEQGRVEGDDDGPESSSPKFNNIASPPLTFATTVIG
jgi:hypothetical protein